MWYVEEYLVPSMTRQGIPVENIEIKCDTERVGNLKSCMDIFSHITKPGGTWHLQDDVVICRRFAERTDLKPEEQSNILCGFVIERDENSKHVGYVKPAQMWWSFPCVYIPNNLARECVRWFYDVAQYKSVYSWMIPLKKFDDYFFKEFMKLNYKDYRVINMKPCLVDHIDYMLGGTTINKERKNKDVRAMWFDDPDLIVELEAILKYDGKYMEAPEEERSDAE